MKVLIKIGGSLSKNPPIFKKLFSIFPELVKNHLIVLLPGGGIFADQIREYHSKYKFSDTAAHKMAIISEDIVGILIGEYLKIGVLTDKLDEIPQIQRQSKIPIFLPSKYLLKIDELPHSWDITSDSIAVYLADKLKIENVILVKDVDGLYSADPKKNAEARLIKSITSSELKKIKNSCVDNALSDFIDKYRIICYLINGNFPERIKQILDGQTAVHSLISP
ncbi:MAG: amino acid kinase family protein [Candidatus Helarchaeota archaeon]